MKEKVLTIAVPSYNASEYLKETIPTMVDVPNKEQLEIIIVNDGSKDNTLETAKAFEEQYQGVIKVIDKENGGHGSTINAAIPQATGKYFKVIDADDWVDSANLSELITYLETCDDDEVISPYYKVFVDTDTKELVSFNISKANTTVQYDKLLEEIGEIPEMHSKTTKTSILQDNHIRLDENCFYVDMEYITYPMPFIKTISYFDKPIYQYRLGTEVQSVNIKNFIKNEKMHEKVLFAVVAFYQKFEKSFSPIEEKLVLKLITRMVSTHYNIFFAKGISKDTLNDLLKVEKALEIKDPKFIKNSYGKKVNLIRKTNYLAYWPIAVADHVKYKLK